jgi:hypothetical protein
MTTTCKDCETAAEDIILNGRGSDCHETAAAKWAARMAIRQDATRFDIGKLVSLLLEQHWMHECEIVTDYMPPNPGESDRPTCIVRYTYEDGETVCLRYSNGPLQGYFWDIYGDDMHSCELALICISKAPAPPKVGLVIPTHGR